jgi:hypothetical protein
MQLQTLWNMKAAKQGAAQISFINDIDDEAIPPISSNFCYLEAGYKLLSSMIFYVMISLTFPYVVRLALGNHQTIF